MENNYYFQYFFGVATEKKVHAKVCFFILPSELCMHLIDTCNLFLVCLVDIQKVKKAKCNTIYKVFTRSFV